MKIQKRNMVLKQLNGLLHSVGATIRLRNMNDSYKNARGVFYEDTREIVIPRNAGHETIAHEFAHALQFHVRGETDCWDRKNTNHELARQHDKMTKDYKSLLANLIPDLLYEGSL